MKSAADAPATSQSTIWSQWEEHAYRVLTREMETRKIGYKGLSRRLDALGITEAPGRLNRKVNRKKFSTAFFLACLSAMEAESLPLGGGLRDSVR